MRKIDKLTHQRYELEMKLIELETKQKRMKLSKNAESELSIIREKLMELEERIRTITD